MSFSLAGLIGAAIGLYIGWIDYKIVIGVLKGAAERQNQRIGKQGFLDRYMEQIRYLVLGCGLIAFPMIGYLAGRSLAG
ncbi:hypothetical protein LC092_05810 [Stappia stellulata]|uniref:hypothetical protein n=1 Tax=Stappia stellulata TaxID=71235 RepID=UPI001CD795AB|nr:hypothetical protein [Stappia stellulata]MCA1241945.1 hypothetical protein [Stappia stellulata]